MRGLRSRLAVLALALALGAAGARSLGTPYPMDGATCSAGTFAGHAEVVPEGPVALGLRAEPVEGWNRPPSERSGAGRDPGARPCGAPTVVNSRRVLAPAVAMTPARAGTGLLGLAGSPANAPPRS